MIDLQAHVQTAVRCSGIEGMRYEMRADRSLDSVIVE